MPAEKQRVYGGGRTIGNPLFLRHDDYLGVVNNLMVTHHVRVMGRAGRIHTEELLVTGKPYNPGSCHCFVRRGYAHMAFRTIEIRKEGNSHGALSEGGRFRIHSVPVLTGIAVLNHEYKQHNGPN